MSSSSIHPQAGVEPAHGSTHSYLAIVVDGHRYGLPLAQVREVLRAVWISPLPAAPAVMLGVIDVRGRFVPVVDMRRRFGRESPALDPSERLVLAWTGSREIALRADSVEWFADIDQAAVEPVKDILHANGFVAGLAHTGDGLLLIQDLSAFLTEAESSAIESALAVFAADAA